MGHGSASVFPGGRHAWRLVFGEPLFEGLQGSCEGVRQGTYRRERCMERGVFWNAHELRQLLLTESEPAGSPVALESATLRPPLHLLYSDPENRRDLLAVHQGAVSWEAESHRRGPPLNQEVSARLPPGTRRIRSISAMISGMMLRLGGSGGGFFGYVHGETTLKSRG